MRVYIIQVCILVYTIDFCHDIKDDQFKKTYYTYIFVFKIA